MTYGWNKLAQLTAIGAGCSLAIWIGATSAKEESVLVKKPVATTAEAPPLPPPANPNNQPAANPKPGPDLFAPQPANPSAQQQPSNNTVKRPFMRPAEPREPARGKLTAGQEPMPMPAPETPGPETSLPAPSTSDVPLQPTPPIVYDTDHDARRMYRASGSVNLMMVTQNPANGCFYEIPLCVPACCIGEPTVSAGRGLLGRGVVEYCWSCGFRAIVKFRQHLGNVRVDYEGD